MKSTLRRAPLALVAFLLLMVVCLGDANQRHNRYHRHHVNKSRTYEDPHPAVCDGDEYTYSHYVSDRGFINLTPSDIYDLTVDTFRQRCEGKAIRFILPTDQIKHMTRAEWISRINSNRSLSVSMRKRMLSHVPHMSMVDLEYDDHEDLLIPFTRHAQNQLYYSFYSHLTTYNHDGSVAFSGKAVVVSLERPQFTRQGRSARMLVSPRGCYILNGHCAGTDSETGLKCCDVVMSPPITDCMDCVCDTD